ncbi:unnamed protein product [Gordionus sp. m RMFG-2023]|uniref:uncharacterized protein LOC135931376 isoform X2 n=1 Tax=Gordionus sp. m RMFG-2023 TaxID=3053472 RepID=UPI0030E37237
MIFKVFVAILFSLRSIQAQKLATNKYSGYPVCNADADECLIDYVCRYGSNMVKKHCCAFCERIGIRTNLTDFLSRFRNDKKFRNIFKCGNYVPGFLEYLFGEMDNDITEYRDYFSSYNKKEQIKRENVLKIVVDN